MSLLLICAALRAGPAAARPTPAPYAEVKGEAEHGQLDQANPSPQPPGGPAPSAPDAPAEPTLLPPPQRPASASAERPAPPARELPPGWLPFPAAPAKDAPARAAGGPRGLRAAGWTLGVLGGAVTAAGLVLIPLRPEEVPLMTRGVPILAAGAAALLTARILFTAAEQRR